MKDELDKQSKTIGTLRQEKLNISTALAEKEEKLTKLQDQLTRLAYTSEEENRQKDAQIQQLIRELNEMGDQDSDIHSRQKLGGNSTPSLQGEVLNLSNQVEMKDEKLRKHHFHLRMIYQTMNQILSRITGRTFIDKSKR